MAEAVGAVAEKISFDAAELGLEDVAALGEEIIAGATAEATEAPFGLFTEPEGKAHAGALLSSLGGTAAEVTVCSNPETGFDPDKKGGSGGGSGGESSEEE